MGESTRPATWPRVDECCAWCGIRLAAVPETPIEWDEKLYHRGVCYSTARLKDASALPADYQPWYPGNDFYARLHGEVPA